MYYYFFFFPAKFFEKKLKRNWKLERKKVSRMGGKKEMRIKTINGKKRNKREKKKEK